jgi:demethoxyubiquinone hydroxylase (CLK1/Coq7/Cat5 family)
MDYDISIIRPQVKHDDVKLRGKGFSPQRLKAIKNALLNLHTLELTATNIYRFQITKEDNEHNRELIAAMLNEMVHYQDFQVKIYEFGWKPKSITRWAYGIVGMVLGRWSRIRGKKAILNTGIWVETRAVKEYGLLLKDVDWDDETRKVVEKNQADEGGHIQRWRSLVASV